MKKTIYCICSIALLLAASTPILAQYIYKEQIAVNSRQLQQKGDSLYLHMEMDVSKIDIDYNRSLTLTPILIATDNQLELPAILINGTNRHRVYLRSITLKPDQQNELNLYKVVEIGKKNDNILHYEVVIPYIEWMNSARLDVKEDLCGCGGHEQEIAMETLINKVDLEKISVPEVKPELIYVEPQKEVVKVRSEEWETKLNFPVNKTVIYPDYMGNRDELVRIESEINSIKVDSNVTITRIEIIGFASPEGPVAINETLSRGRANALKEYLASKFDMPSDLYSVEYGGENWDGLITMLQASDINDKDKILSIINNTTDVATRKRNLQTFNGGVPYREMLTTIYPKLRKVVCNVYYNVKSFSVDEAKAVLKTSPHQLSLNEIFQIAGTYPAGSDASLWVFETAVKMYPNDSIANLNLAAAALAREDLETAQIYLDKSNNNTPEYSNNKGVFYMLRGEAEKAKIEFEKAIKGGVEAAKSNLKKLE